MTTTISYKRNEATQVAALVREVLPNKPALAALVNTYVFSRFEDLDLLFTFHQTNRGYSFTAYSETERQQIGRITYTWRRTLPNGDFGDEQMVLASFNPGKTYELARDTSHIYVERLDVFAPFEDLGIATQLLRCAIEWSVQKGCGGRVLLEAYKNSHWWYHNRGFRFSESSTFNGKEFEWRAAPTYYDSGLANIIKEARAAGKKPDSTSFGGRHMYLPIAESTRFVNEVQAVPFLTQANIVVLPDENEKAPAAAPPPPEKSSNGCVIG